MKKNRSIAYHWLFTLLLALGMMIAMNAAVFAEDGQARSENAEAEPNDVIRINPGETVDVTIADQYSEVVLQVPVLDETAEMHFWTDHVCAYGTLYHMDGAYYDSGYNGFDLRDTGFQGEYYELHCSVVDGYTDMTYDVHYELNDWASENDAEPLIIKGLKVKSTKKKKAKVSWTANNAVAGYAIQYSTNRNFKKAKTRKILKTAKTKDLHTAAISSLKSKKVYYFRIAPLRYTGEPGAGTTKRGEWSTIVKAKIK